MEPLAKTYKKNGYHFEQVKREGDVAIYRQIDPESGNPVAFEVFEIQKNKAREIAGKQIRATESTPSNEEWGSYGFTVWDLRAAEEKAGILQARIESRNLGKRSGSPAIL